MALTSFPSQVSSTSGELEACIQIYGYVGVCALFRNVDHGSWQTRKVFFFPSGNSVTRKGQIRTVAVRPVA